jgi:hypothetical protein
MVDRALSTADLLEVTGFHSPGALRRSLEKQGVPFFEGKDGPWTTIDLLNAVKLGRETDRDRYSPEML